jgi:putative transposase
VAFIDAHRHRFGVEPICAVLQEHGVGIAPSTYYAAKKRAPSARAVRDARLRPVIARAHQANYDAYGAAKVWDHLNRVQGVRVARCTVERLMAQMGLTGARRGKTPRTTTPAAGEMPEDLVRRDFGADAPNRLWLADLTWVRARSGWVYMAFVIDAYSRRVLGWQASRSLRTDLALDALDMAIAVRRRCGHSTHSTVHHSDRGSQYVSIRYSQRLDDNDIVASVGAKGDSYDNAMIESFNGLFKWELIYPRGPWREQSDVEFATLEYIDWYNHRRSHSQLLPGRYTYTTPADHETAYYQNTTAAPAVAQQKQPLPNPGGHAIPPLSFEKT